MGAGFAARVAASPAPARCLTRAGVVGAFAAVGAGTGVPTLRCTFSFDQRNNEANVRSGRAASVGTCTSRFAALTRPPLLFQVLSKLEAKSATLERLDEMTAREIGEMVRHPRAGDKVKDLVASVRRTPCALACGTRGPALAAATPLTPPLPCRPPSRQIPHLELSAAIQPITRGILRITLQVTPAFKWSTKIHGNSEPWWIWVEDAENDHMYDVACCALLRHARVP